MHRFVNNMYIKKLLDQRSVQQVDITLSIAVFLIQILSKYNNLETKERD